MGNAHNSYNGFSFTECYASYDMWDNAKRKQFSSMQPNVDQNMLRSLVILTFCTVPWQLLQCCYSGKLLSVLRVIVDVVGVFAYPSLIYMPSWR